MKRQCFTVIFFFSIFNIVAGKTYNHNMYFGRLYCKHAAPSDSLLKAIRKHPASTVRGFGSKNDKFYRSYTRVIRIGPDSNQIFSSPNFNDPDNRLISILLKAIKIRKVTAYGELGTPTKMASASFSRPLTYNQVLSRIAHVVIVDRFDNEGNKTGTRKVVQEFNPDSIRGYSLKEVVYLNKQTRTINTRIVGIAPLINLTSASGDTLGTRPLFWLNYPQSRAFFSHIRVEDPDRNLYDVSLNDILVGHRFSSYITEELNPDGDRIKGQTTDPAMRDKEPPRFDEHLNAYKNSLHNGTTIQNNGTGVAKTNLHLYHTYTRELSTKLPQGQIYDQPGNRLLDALLRAIKHKKIQAYGNLANPKNVLDEPFITLLSYDKVAGRVYDTLVVKKPGQNDNNSSVLTVREYNPENMPGYRLKAIVYSNNRTKKAETKIVGLAPLKYVILGGNTIGYYPIFWIKYRQARPILSSIKVPAIGGNHNISNLDVAMTTRLNDWKIVEESNSKGLRIKEYVQGPEDQDKEAARIEKKLANFKNGFRQSQ